MASAAPKHTKISKAKARLLMEHPFFATLLLRTEIVVGKFPGIDTAATDGERHYYDEDFLESLSVEDTMAVMCHEVGHDALLHSVRMGARNPATWNEAGDHAINLMLEDQGMKAPKALSGGWLADKKYAGLSADRIYDDLRRNPPPKQPNPQGGGKPGGSGKAPLQGDVLPSPGKADPASQAAAEQRAKQRVASAANMARMAGKLTGELARMVDECLETKILWTDVLRDYMLQVVKERENWSRRNRRFTEIYLPTRRSQKMGPMIFIPDTSGSMMGDDMEKICSEMAHCATQTQPENIRVVWADAKVKGEQVFTAHDFSYAALQPKGGGGTDMRVPLKHVEQYDPLVVVLMTDCYTPWPDIEPDYPVITLSTTKLTAPFGMTINI